MCSDCFEYDLEECDCPKPTDLINKCACSVGKHCVVCGHDPK